MDFTVDEINLWLPFFISEIRRKDGGHFKAKSIFEFVICIQCLFMAKRGISYHFLKDAQFVPVKNSLDNVMKKLQRLGFGHDPKKVCIISSIVEEELWSSGALGDSSPRILLRTLVFVLGINLGLRSGEHRKLRWQMFEVIYTFQIKYFLWKLYFFSFFLLTPRITDEAK